MFVMNPSSLNGGLVLLLLFLFFLVISHLATVTLWYNGGRRFDGSSQLCLFLLSWSMDLLCWCWCTPLSSSFLLHANESGRFGKGRRMDAEEDKRCRSQAWAVLSFFSGETVVASWSFWGNCSFSLQIVFCTAVCNRWLSTHFLSFFPSLTVTAGSIVYFQQFFCRWILFKSTFAFFLLFFKFSSCLFSGN